MDKCENCGCNLIHFTKLSWCKKCDKVFRNGEEVNPNNFKFYKRTFDKKEKDKIKKRLKDLGHIQ